MADETNETPKPVRQPRRSKIGGLALIVAAPIVAVWLFLLIYRATDDGRFWIYGAGFLAVGAACLVQVGLQLRAPDAIELLSHDMRPPIVFLRPFREDHRVIHGAPVGDREGGERPDRMQTSETKEHMLARMFRDVGPFIAVGQPGESLATLGAARMYLSHHEWMDTVQGLVHRALAVVLQPEFSSGTLWEVELVVKAVDLRRLLLVVPGPHLRPLRFMRVRDLVRERFGVILPALEDCPPCEAFYFGNGKTPIPLRLDSNAAKTSKPFLDHLRALGDTRMAKL